MLYPMFISLCVSVVVSTYVNFKFFCRCIAVSIVVSDIYKYFSQHFGRGTLSGFLACGLPALLAKFSHNILVGEL